MPRKGYRNITVSDEVYNDLETKAKKKNLSIPKHLELLSKNGGCTE